MSIHSRGVKLRRRGSLRTVAPAFLSFVFLTFFAAPAHACTCEAKPDLDQALDDAAMVFVGRVVSKSVNPLRPEEQEVKFTITRRLKNFDEITGNTILIYTPRDHEYCGYKFGEGLDYLVFAAGTPAHFKTTSCTRTEVLENSLTDVQKLIRMTGATAPAPH